MGLLIVVLPGFEPGQAEPKPAVLPLHHKTIRFGRHKDKDYFLFTQIFLMVPIIKPFNEI